MHILIIFCTVLFITFEVKAEIIIDYEVLDLIKQSREQLVNEPIKIETQTIHNNTKNSSPELPNEMRMSLKTKSLLGDKQDSNIIFKNKDNHIKVLPINNVEPQYKNINNNTTNEPIRNSKAIVLQPKKKTITAKRRNTNIKLQDNVTTSAKKHLLTNIKLEYKPNVISDNKIQMDVKRNTVVSPETQQGKY